MKETIFNKAAAWTRKPFDNETCKEIETLISDNNEKELEDRFYRDLSFGTGGLRGKIGAGSNRMNRYTVGLATQGLAVYLLKNNLAGMGVVIAYDSRNYSRDFAQETASVLAANNIQVYLFDKLTPVPLCSFAIRKLSAAAGVVITASHNPPEYNGYKVYSSDGCQIVPPQDSDIINEISQINNIESIKRDDFTQSVKEKRIIIIGNDIRSEYTRKVTELLSTNDDKKINIVYSPIHGSGITIIPEILSNAGFKNLHIVKEQEIPDGNFPTVKYPNPEEKEAMLLAIKEGKKVKADIILATDPDADRIGVGVKQDDDFVLLNGNQLAVLLCDYILSNLSEHKKINNKTAVVKTIITTELLRAVCDYYSVKTFDVLTGFKWIGALMRDFERSQKNDFVFGCEESYGYLALDFVRDKDAVSSTLLVCEMAEQYREKGLSLLDRLDQIYLQHGYFCEQMRYIVLEGSDGAEKITAIMENFRNDPPYIVDGKKLKTVKDYHNQIQMDILTEKKSDLDDLPKSDVLQYNYTDGSSFAIRPSGTEPKIKFYISAVKKAADKDIHSARESAEKSVNNIMRYIQDRIKSL